MRKSKGRGWRFVQYLRAINHIVIPRHPVIPDPHTLLASIPAGRQFFTVIDLCNAFASIPVDEDSQYLFAFTWEGKQFTWTVMPRGFTDSPSYFSKILKSDLDDIIFPKDSTLLQYVDDLVLGSSSQVLLKYDSIHLLTLLALKEHKVSKEKLRFAPSSGSILGTSDIGTKSAPGSRLHGILCFPRSKTKLQL